MGKSKSATKSKWIVAALFGSVLLLRHDCAALWAVIGSVSNSALSVALKRLLNQERPVATLRSDPGMPSSHAQSISFISVFSLFSVIEWLGTNVLSLFLGGLILALGSYFVLEEKSENVAPGTVLGTTHTYVIRTGTQEKTGAKRVDLLRGQKTDRVEVSLQPEELEAMDTVLPAKYEEAREEEKLRNKPESFSDMVAENELKRRRKTHDKEGKKKKKDFKF